MKKDDFTVIETQCEMIRISELQTTRVIKDDITCNNVRILYNCELHDTRMRKKDDIINEMVQKYLWKTITNHPTFSYCWNWLLINEPKLEEMWRWSL
jgi:hypothetical protein